MYELDFDEDWKKYFQPIENDIKERVAKKIGKILLFPEKRHLKGKADYFTDEIGQYRITYRIIKENNKVRFYFIGKHKEYEKWYKQFY